MEMLANSELLSSIYSQAIKIVLVKAIVFVSEKISLIMK